MHWEISFGEKALGSGVVKGPLTSSENCGLIMSG